MLTNRGRTAPTPRGWDDRAPRHTELPHTVFDTVKKKQKLTIPRPVLIVVGVVAILFVLWLLGIFSIFSSRAQASGIVYTDLYEVPAEKAALWDAYFRWMTNNGMTIARDKVRVRYAGPNRGYGLYALANLQKEQQLFSIPLDIIFYGLSPHSKTRHLWTLAHTAGFFETAGNLTMNAISLMVERGSKDSFWRPWFDVLSFPECPHFYNDAELAEFQHFDMRARADVYINSSRDTYRDVILPKFMESYPDIFGTPTNPKFSMQDFEEAVAIILQRAFSYDYNWVLVPYLEIINSELIWDENEGIYQDINGYNIDNDQWIDRAVVEWKKGEEVLGVYSTTATTLNYLIQYGYVTPNNRNDYMLLKLDMEGVDPSITAVIGDQVEALVGHDYEVPFDFLNAMVRVSVGPPADEDAYWEEPTLEQLWKAQQQLKTAITQHLKSKPTTLEFDKKAFETLNSAAVALPGVNLPRLGTAMNYRIQVKTFLLGLLQALGNRRFTIDEEWRYKEVNEEEHDAYFALDEVVLAASTLR